MFKLRDYQEKISSDALDILKKKNIGIEKQLKRIIHEIRRIAK